ncbi:MAG TPA: hypothetical protein VFS72_02565, partial [Agromyces sp.]|nr:hypothetical protein [Agromyces sp.]
DRARALVMTLLMGREGVDLVRQFASQATGMGVSRNAYWGEVITSGLPKAVMGTVADRLRRMFIRQFAVRGSAGIIGRAIPFGIGAAIGGVGNHVLGRRVLQQARLAFGAPPQLLPIELEPREPGEGTVVRAGRRGAAFSTAVISASSRGLRTAGRAIGRRRGPTDAATGAVEPPVPNPSPTPPDGTSPPAP